MSSTTRTWRKDRGKDIMMGRGGRRRKQLLNDLEETSGYCNLKEEAQDRTLRRTCFARCHWPVARRYDNVSDSLSNVEYLLIVYQWIQRMCKGRGVIWSTVHAFSGRVWENRYPSVTMDSWLAGIRLFDLWYGERMLTIWPWVRYPSVVSYIVLIVGPALYL